MYQSYSNYAGISIERGDRSIVQQLARRPTAIELGCTFAWITLIAFGGGAPWVKRVAVDDRRWMTLDEFAEVASFCQSMPGAIYFNLAVTIGMRERGFRGAAAALLGVTVPAIVVACIIEHLQAQLDANIFIHHALGGIVAAATGLFASTFVQLTQVTWKRLGFGGAAVAIAALGAIILLHWPLPVVVAGFGALGTWYAWRLVPAEATP